MSSFSATSVAVLLILIHNILESSVAQEQSDALFLTPYIEANQIVEAKRLSLVHNLSSSVVSYSGFITVDKDNGANIFFWFFPAAQKHYFVFYSEVKVQRLLIFELDKENPEDAPVLLWSEGGPGVSALFSIFTEHGPFSVELNGDLKLRETTWTKNHSIIYLDQPMDVAFIEDVNCKGEHFSKGYSFIDHEEGYVTSGAAAAPNIYNFLIQFFKLFPELQDNHFYNSGGSFGAIYAPAVAHYIHTKNQQNPEISINLKGLILESPFTDPISQVDYGEFLYPVGLIDEHALVHFRERSALIKQLISEEKFLEAQEINLELLWGSPTGTYFTNVTGFISTYNILKDQLDEAFGYILIAEPKFRKHLHVGNLTFTFVSPLVRDLFKPNTLRSAKHFVEDLLDWGYKTLIYVGNLDIITCHTGVEAMIKSFNWTGAAEHANAPRKIWKVDGAVAGYTKSTKNFTQALVRNSGHGVTADQPVWSFDLLNKFTKGEEI